MPIKKKDLCGQMNGELYGYCYHLGTSVQTYKETYAAVLGCDAL